MCYPHLKIHSLVFVVWFSKNKYVFDIDTYFVYKSVGFFFFCCVWKLSLYIIKAKIEREVFKKM